GPPRTRQAPRDPTAGSTPATCAARNRATLSIASTCTVTERDRGYPLSMLYKFKSKAAGDLIMLEPNGRRVLQIIGKDAGPKGIVLPEEMPGAVAALESAIAAEDAEHQAAIDDAKANGRAA